MRALILAAVAAGCGATAQAPQTDLDWISGYWLACESGETAESWIGAGRGVLLGANLSRSGFEFLRIAENEEGRLTYYAMPNGRSPPTPFELVSNVDQRAVFENPAHDFPQRIIYERNGDVMVARVEGQADGRNDGIEWRFSRAAPDARCPP